MKKVICILTVVSLIFCNSLVTKAAEYNELEVSKLINEYDLEKVEDLPEDIVPIQVNNEQELATLLKQLEEVYSDVGIDPNNLDDSEMIEKGINISNVARSTQVVNNKTITNQETIFDLSALGGKIVSDVNYTYSYWVAPESYKTTINYHDVYETGIYGFQEITYTNKSATTTGPWINVNVRGYSKVYIGLSGGGASGNLVLKTFQFDKTYSIIVGS